MSFISVIIIVSVGSDLISVQAQYGRPPGIKDVLYDDRGNVVAVMKISPEKLPSHRYVAISSKVTLVHHLGGRLNGSPQGEQKKIVESQSLTNKHCKKMHVSIVINLPFLPILFSISAFQTNF